MIVFAKPEPAKFRVSCKGFSVRVVSTEDNNANSVTIVEIKPHTDNDSYAHILASLIQRELTAHGEGFLVQMPITERAQKEMDERMEDIVQAFSPYIERRMSKIGVSEVVRALFINNQWGDDNDNSSSN
jgi:hypothetical protein